MGSLGYALLDREGMDVFKKGRRRLNVQYCYAAQECDATKMNKERKLASKKAFGI